MADILTPLQAIKEEAWTVSLDKIKQLYNLTKDDECDLMATQKFFDKFLNIRRDNLKDAKSFCIKYNIDKKPVFGYKISVVCVDMFLQINSMITGKSTGVTKKIAKAKAAAKVMDLLKSIGYNPLLPERVIGLPNYRGHCFAIPTLVPIFNDARFCEAIEKLSSFINARRDNFEFCGKFVALFRQYLNCSRLGQVVINAAPTGLEKASEEYEYIKNIASKERPKGKKPCLDLDKSLTNVLAVLLEKSDREYGTPGEHPTKFIADICTLIRKELASFKLENPIEELFKMKIKYTWDCEDGCGRDEPKNIILRHFSLRTLAYHGETLSLQEKFNQPHIYFRNFTLCKNKIDGENCKAEVNLLEVEFIGWPYFLMVQFLDHYNNYVNLVPTILPPCLSVQTSNNQNIIYERFAQSFYIEEGGDPEALHTYVALKLYDRWIEINNNRILPCTSEIGLAQGKNFVLYRRAPTYDRKNYPKWQEE